MPTKKIAKPIIKKRELQKTETVVREERNKPESITVAPAKEIMPNVGNAKKPQALRRIGPLSYGKIGGLGMAIFGLVYGLALAILFASGLPLNATTAQSLGAIQLYQTMGWWLVLVMPVAYGILGFVFGILGAALYNLIAKWVGGVELVIE